MCHRISGISLCVCETSEAHARGTCCGRVWPETWAGLGGTAIGVVALMAVTVVVVIMVKKWEKGV